MCEPELYNGMTPITAIEHGSEYQLGMVKIFFEIINYFRDLWLYGTNIKIRTCLTHIHKNVGEISISFKLTKDVVIRGESGFKPNLSLFSNFFFFLADFEQLY